jgi:hypothetical protein
MKPLKKHVLEKFRSKCVRCRRYTGVVHEIIPKSRKKDWDAYGNQVPLCPECHDWAHSIGTRKSSIILQRFRDRRLLEYNLVIDNIPEFVEQKDSELYRSYGRVLLLNESDWKLIAETLQSQAQTIKDLQYLLDLEREDNE